MRIPFRRQRGITLIESLVAFAIASLGAVSVLRLQKDLHLNSDLSGRRAEAARLGQSAIERNRATAGSEGDPGPMAPGPVPTPEPGMSFEAYRGTRFTVASTTLPMGFSQTAGEAGSDLEAPSTALDTQVWVAWSDPAGNRRRQALRTVLDPADPALSAALFIRPVNASIVRMDGRAASIPAFAVQLGDGRSAWQPNSSSPVVWLFDNATGHIISRCSRTSSTGFDATLTAVDLSRCVASNARLLSGIVRTSLSAVPDAVGANDPPSDGLAVVLTLTVPGNTPPIACTTRPRHSVEAVFGVNTGQVVRRIAVDLDATPASIGASRWTDLPDRFVDYNCIVPTPSEGWSGRTTLAPAHPTSGSVGWTIGTGAGEQKICRYVALPEVGTSTDVNLAHPAGYSHVTTSLPQQNFLIVRGDRACPGPVPGTRVATLQQQP